MRYALWMSDYRAEALQKFGSAIEQDLDEIHGLLIGNHYLDVDIVVLILEAEEAVKRKVI